jgi:hypothetical protein
VADGGLAGFATFLYKTGTKLVSRYCNRYGGVWGGGEMLAISQGVGERSPPSLALFMLHSTLRQWQNRQNILRDRYLRWAVL